MEDFERLRARRAASAAPDPDRTTGGPPAFVGQVTTVGGVVGRFIQVNRVVITGPEVEGAAAVQTVDASAAVPVYYLGPGSLAAGDLVVCRFVDYRWTAEKATTGPPKFSACCSSAGGLPGTISATFVHEVPENGISANFPMAPMTYGAVPEAGVGLPTTWWYSAPVGPPNVHLPDSRMVLTLQCVFNSLVLGYIYKIGSLTDPPVYSWSLTSGQFIGGPLYEIGTFTYPLTTLNTCSPFLMSAIDWSQQALVFVNIDDASGLPLTSYPQIILS